MIACVYPRSHVVGSGSGNAGAALESEASATEVRPVGTWQHARLVAPSLGHAGIR